MPLTENSGQVFLPGGCNRTQNLRFGPYTISLLLTGKFRKGVTERVRLKRTFTRGVYATVVYSIILPYEGSECTVHIQNLL